MFSPSVCWMLPHLIYEMRIVEEDLLDVVVVDSEGFVLLYT